MLYLRQVLTAVAALLVASTIAWADTYTIASFSGAINGGSANVKPPFSGNGFTQGDSISGSFVFDNQLVPPPASGFRNVFFSTFPDIAAIPPALKLTNVPFGAFATDARCGLMHCSSEAQARNLETRSSGFFLVHGPFMNGIRRRVPPWQSDTGDRDSRSPRPVLRSAAGLRTSTHRCVFRATCKA